MLDKVYRNLCAEGTIVSPHLLATIKSTQSRFLKEKVGSVEAGIMDLDRILDFNSLVLSDSHGAPIPDSFLVT
jgi:hypothetical protein